ncbi:peptidylprolyl isomerase [Sandaracinus amylolyticus]|uniref:peptidylprolyl isomerase n=1 Tax=Sandaracinus amylolyticus TaxID=927083 RepID=UPI001F002781|nr:peptidyl-prolyl cis-trans isomerase [Sandaracinus amylolyticus]UJR79732.1 Peptidylprolyl isomerase [Sandaracinus amylolyticus]
MHRRLLILLALSALGSIALACGDDGDTPATTTQTGTSAEPTLRHGLTEAQAAETLAKIGDRTITVGEFADEIASKGPFLRARYNSPERRRELIDQMVRFELLAQEADREGFDDLPDVQRTRKQILIRRFLKQQYEDRIQLSDVSDEDVRRYYEAHRGEFNKPEQVRASHILIRNRATAERVLRQVLEDPTNVRAFRELAERHNEDPETRDRFGDLRFFSRPEERQPEDPAVPDEVARAAFSITTIGGVHGELVQTERGFHIVKLTGRRAALSRSLEEATRPIRHRLWRERREQAVEELVTRLRGEADVEENLDLLSQVHIDAPADATPMQPSTPEPSTPTPPTAPRRPRPPTKQAPTAPPQ